MAWARLRGDRLGEREWLDRFRASLAPTATVLDLGCGSGLPIAAYLRSHGHAVTGVDSAPAMIALARETMADGDWHLADMRTLSLGRRFGGVIAWDSFFHLAPDDQRAMFAIFRQHAEPGAPLMFTSGPEAGEALGVLEGETLYHASLAPAEYRALFADHGFTVIGHVSEDPECGGRTVWLARHENVSLG